MKEQLLQLLKEARPDVDFEKEDKLIDNSMLDSFDIIQIVMDMNETFGIEINVEDLQPENFNSIQGMLELITRLQNE